MPAACSLLVSALCVVVEYNVALAAPKINLSAALFELGKYCRRRRRRVLCRVLCPLLSFPYLLSSLPLLHDSERRCLLREFVTDHDGERE